MEVLYMFRIKDNRDFEVVTVRGLGYKAVPLLDDLY
jgi:hypothetical protein